MDLTKEIWSSSNIFLLTIPSFSYSHLSFSNSTPHQSSFKLHFPNIHKSPSRRHRLRKSIINELPHSRENFCMFLLFFLFSSIFSSHSRFCVTSGLEQFQLFRYEWRSTCGSTPNLFLHSLHSLRLFIWSFVSSLIKSLVSFY